MNAIRPSPAGPLPSRIDSLLRDFFRAEMPDRWPVPTLPIQEPRAATLPVWRRLPLTRSRFALAASVALLLVASWYLAGRTPETTLAIEDHGPIIGDVATHRSPLLPGKVRTPAGRKAVIRPSVIQEFDLVPDADGNLMPRRKPTTYRFDVHELP